MSTTDNIEKLKSRFENSPPKSASLVTRKYSPPITGKPSLAGKPPLVDKPSLAATGKPLFPVTGKSSSLVTTNKTSPGNKPPSSSGVGKLSPSKYGSHDESGGKKSPCVSKKLTKELNAALSQKDKGAPGCLAKPSPPSKSKSVSPATKPKMPGKFSGVDESKRPTEASSALASILQGTALKNRNNRPHENEGDVSITNSFFRREPSATSPQQQSRNKARAKSMELTQFRAIPDNRGFNSSLESSTGEECLIHRASPVFIRRLSLESSVSSSEGEICGPKKKDVSFKNKWNNITSGIDKHLKTGSKHQSLEKTSPKKIQDMSISRSQDSIIDTEISDRQKKAISLTCDALVSPAHATLGKKPLPFPKNLPKLSPDRELSKPRSSSDVTNSGEHAQIHVTKEPTKPKSTIGGAKPVVGGVKPSLPGNKPTTSKAKPIIPGKKPPVSTMNSKVTNSESPQKTKPQPPPKVTEKNSSLSPSKKGPTLPVKPPQLNDLRDESFSNKVQRSISPEVASLEDKSHTNPNTNSNPPPIQKDTLARDSDDKMMVDIETTKITNGLSKFSSKLPSSKPINSQTSHSRTEVKSAFHITTKSPPSCKNKPLPFPPPPSGERESLRLISHSSTESDSSSPKPSNKVSSLRDKFSTPSSTPSNKFKPSKLPSVDSQAARVIGDFTNTPSPISPQIRITPGSFSGGAANEQEQTHEGGGETNSRGNVDSGFISDALDEQSLLKGAASIESLPESITSGGREGPEGTPSLPGLSQSDTNEAKTEPEVWDKARLEKASKKRLNIAQELLETEKTYSSHIKTVAVDFYDMIQQYNQKSKQLIPMVSINLIFLNIKQIHQLSENILQELQARMDAWNTHEALGDVICRLAPFLKLYSTYTAGFEDAVKTLTECTKKDRKFDAVVREFESSTISTGMGVASFMLEPVQRIPRYRLLLLDYLKYLPPDSPDRSDTESALRIISEAADRSNDRIKELENSNIVLSIQRSLVDYEGQLVAPSRSLLKKGPLLKSSRKALCPRFFFLFSDILLHTSPEKDVYKFRNEIPIFKMKVENPKASLTPFSFNIYSTTRSLILVASSEEEKQSWINALESAIRDDLKKRSSLRRDVHLQLHKVANLFGTKAPIMVPDKSVTMCQSCSAEFTFTFRRHHCRACGKVVCGVCSQQKVYLPYLEKSERVCEPCYLESKNPDRTSDATDSDPDTPDHPTPKKQESTASSGSGVLRLKAYEEDAMIAGYVQCQDGRKWNKMWYQIKKDCVLYKFKAHEDIKAIVSMPLPGYAVGSDSNQRTITLNHHSGIKSLCETFKLEDQPTFEKWLESILKVIRMEFDDISSPNQTTSPLTHDEVSLGDNTEQRPTSPSQHNLGGQDNGNLRFDSFSTASTDSRPSSMREVSLYDEGEIVDSFDSEP